MVIAPVAAPVAVLIDRERAQELARRELGKSEYHRDDPGLVQRVVEWLQDRLQDLVDRASGFSPTGWLGILVLLGLAVLLVVLVLHRMGGVRRTAGSGEALLEGRVRTADEHRAEADAALAAGRFDLAIRERLRAVARELESRGVLDARPGRTADELARDGGAALPALAEPLRAASLVFDDVWYGGRPATAEGHAVVARADTLVVDTRLVSR